MELILESLAAGMNIARLVDAYPSLTEESVRGVLAELAHRKDLQLAMKILLDENLPRKLVPALRAEDHELESVHTLRAAATTASL